MKQRDLFTGEERALLGKLGRTPAEAYKLAERRDHWEKEYQEATQYRRSARTSNDRARAAHRAREATPIIANCHRRIHEILITALNEKSFSDKVKTGVNLALEERVALRERAAPEIHSIRASQSADLELLARQQEQEAASLEAELATERQQRFTSLQRQRAELLDEIREVQRARSAQIDDSLLILLKQLNHSADGRES